MSQFPVARASLQSRRMIGDYEMYHRDEKGNLLDGLFKFEVMITTYEMVKIMGKERRDRVFSLARARATNEILS